MGTLDYLAPEQALETSSVDIRADIYSLGCTLYHLLCGQPPFRGPEYTASLKKMMAHAQTPPVPVREWNPQVPIELDRIVGRMLAKSPDDRFATPAEVAAALVPFCAEAQLAQLLATVHPGGPAPAAAGTISTASGSASPSQRALAAKTTAMAMPAAAVRRPSGRGGLIAAGFGMAALVLLAGILIKITTKDKKTIEVNVAVDGDDVESVNIDLAGQVPRALDHPPVPLRLAEPKSQPASAPASQAPLKIVAPTPVPDSADPPLPGLIPRPERLPGMGRWQIVPTHDLATFTAWSLRGTLAVGSQDGTIRLYDPAAGKLTGVLIGHRGAVHNLRWTKDGDKLASSSQDGTTRVWSAEGRPLHVLKWNGVPLAWNPEGTQLATHYEDGVAIWNDEGRRIAYHPFPHVNELDWSPDGTWLAVRSEQPSRLTLVSPKGQPGPSWAMDAPYGNVAWSPDGTWLATAEMDPAEFRVRLWKPDGTSGPILKTRPEFGQPMSVAWQPSGQQLLVSYTGNVAQIWNVDGTPGPELGNKITNEWAGSPTWSPDGKQVAACLERQAHVWNVADVPRLEFVAACPHALQLARSDSGKLLADTQGSRVFVWTNAGKLQRTFEVPGQHPHAVAFHPNETQIAAGTTEGEVRLWPLEGEQQAETVARHDGAVYALTWHPDGSRLFSGGRDGTLRSRRDDGARSTWQGAGYVSALLWNDDGLQLTSLGNQHLVWNPADGTKQTLPTGEHVYAAARVRDGRLLKVGIHETRLFGPAGEEETKFHTSGQFAIAASPDGEQYLTRTIPYTMATRSLAGTVTGQIEHRGVGREVAGCAWDGSDRITLLGQNGRLFSQIAGQPDTAWIGIQGLAGRAASFDAQGRLLSGTPEELAGIFTYAVEQADGSCELLTPAEFAARAADARTKGAVSPLPPAAVDVDRQVALELLQHGALLHVRGLAIDQVVERPEELPEELFVVSVVRFWPEKPFKNEFLRSLPWLGNLAELYLDRTGVTDAGLEHVVRVTSLRAIVLSGTEITDAGLQHLRGLSKLDNLQVIGTRITANAVEVLSSFPNMETLAWDGSVTDDGFRSIGKLVKLRRLTVFNAAHVTDAGLEHLAGLNALQHCELQGTGITGAGLKHLAGMTKLEVLSLPNASLLNDLSLQAVPPLPELTSLGLTGTSVPDAAVREFSRFPKLKQLWLQATRVGDAGLAELKAVAKLESLDLAGLPKVTDAGLKSLYDLPQLRQLYLSGTGVTAAGVQALREKLPNCKIEANVP